MNVQILERFSGQLLAVTNTVPKNPRKKKNKNRSLFLTVRKIFCFSPFFFLFLQITGKKKGERQKEKTAAPLRMFQLHESPSFAGALDLFLLLLPLRPAP